MDPQNGHKKNGPVGLFNNRYRIEKELGRGGGGVVYKAWDEQEKRLVALKMLAENPTQASLQRFEIEAANMSKLQHQNIIPLYEYGVSGGRFFLAMQYCNGVTLKDYLKNNDVSPTAIARILIKVCEAVEYAHSQNIIHRDLKPANIMVDGTCVWVLDFGIARDVSQNDIKLTATNAVLGTPAYSAPEQLDKSRQISFNCDVYPLGICLYEALAGSLPYENGEDNIMALLCEIANPNQAIIPLHKKMPKCSEGSLKILSDLCNTAICKDPAERLKTVEGFREKLEDYIVEARKKITRRTLNGQKNGKPATVSPLLAQLKYACGIFCFLFVSCLAWALSNSSANAKAVELQTQNSSLVKENADLQLALKTKTEETTKLSAEFKSKANLPTKKPSDKQLSKSQLDTIILSIGEMFKILVENHIDYGNAKLNVEIMKQWLAFMPDTLADDKKVSDVAKEAIRLFEANQCQSGLKKTLDLINSIKKEAALSREAKEKLPWVTMLNGTQYPTFSDAMLGINLGDFSAEDRAKLLFYRGKYLYQSNYWLPALLAYQAALDFHNEHQKSGSPLKEAILKELTEVVRLIEACMVVEKR